MENFFYDDEFFCMDIGCLIDRVVDDEDEIKDLPEDWSVIVELTELEPVYTFRDKDIERLVENVYEDRLTEDGSELDEIEKILKENIDFNKINALVPKLYYGNGKKEIITKQDLLDYIN